MNLGIWTNYLFPVSASKPVSLESVRLRRRRRFLLVPLSPSSFYSCPSSLFLHLLIDRLSQRSYFLNARPYFDRSILLTTSSIITTVAAATTSPTILFLTVTMVISFVTLSDVIFRSLFITLTFRFFLNTFTFGNRIPSALYILINNIGNSGIPSWNITAFTPFRSFGFSPWSDSPRAESSR